VNNTDTSNNAKWADRFGFTIGLGEGKTEAMFISHKNVWFATKAGQKHRKAQQTDDEANSSDSSDSDEAPQAHGLLKGQKLVNGKVVGSHTPRAAPFIPTCNCRMRYQCFTN
jgi:hypothetical protein